MRTEIITITPEMSEKWLKLNPVNRQIKKSKVREYTNAMVQGEWALTGEPIIFNTEGNLLNGQHRLLASVESQMPFQSLVVFDSQADISKLDMGASRTTADVIDILSSDCKRQGISKVLEGAWYSLRTYSVTGWITNVPTPYQRAKAILNNDRLLRLAYQYKVRYKTRLLRPSNALAISYIGDLAGENPERIRKFITKIRDGVGELIIAGEPAAIYRAFMEEAKDKKVLYQNPQQLKFAIKALSYDLDNRKLSAKSLGTALEDDPKPQILNCPPEKIHESLGLK